MTDKEIIAKMKRVSIKLDALITREFGKSHFVVVVDCNGSGVAFGNCPPGKVTQLLSDVMLRHSTGDRVDIPMGRLDK